MVNFLTLDLNLLRVLDALLREGSTVKAGNRLGLSQPAVSSALTRLRHGLGDELFVRQGQGIVPTDYARTIAIPLRTELDRLERILNGPRLFDPRTTDMTYRIAGSDFFNDHLMPALARRLGEVAPGIRAQLVELVPNSYISSLDRYEASVALVPTEAFPEWVEEKPMFRSSFDVIARHGHPAVAAAGLRTGDVMPLDLFCDIGQILFSPEGNLRAMGDAALDRIGRKRRVMMTLPSFYGVCRCVAKSDWIALVPRQYAEMAAPELGLDWFKPPMQIPTSLIVGAWHKRASDNPAHRWMLDQIAAILQPLNEGEEPLPA